jgi:hypothetical protein
MDVTAADAARGHLNQNVSGAAHWNGKIFDPQLLVVGQNQCIHISFAKLIQ